MESMKRGRMDGTRDNNLTESDMLQNTRKQNKIRTSARNIDGPNEGPHDGPDDPHMPELQIRNNNYESDSDDESQGETITPKYNPQYVALVPTSVFAYRQIPTRRHNMTLQSIQCQINTAMHTEERKPSKAKDIPPVPKNILDRCK